MTTSTAAMASSPPPPGKREKVHDDDHEQTSNRLFYLLPEELLSHVMGFPTLRELSTFYRLSVAQKDSQDKVISATINALKERSNDSILKHAPDSLCELWNEEFDNMKSRSVQQSRTGHVPSIRRLCILLRYLEITETFTRKSLKVGHGMQFCWPNAVLMASGSRHPLLLSTPSFTQKLLFALQFPPSSTRQFMLLDRFTRLEQESSIGVLSWNPDARNKWVSGLRVFHDDNVEQLGWEYRATNLMWMTQYRRNKPLIQASEKLSWLIQSVEEDTSNHRFCYWEFDDDGIEETDDSFSKAEIFQRLEELCNDIAQHMHDL